MANKFVAFFSTEAGKNVAGAATVGALLAGVLADYLPNTYMKDHMRDFLQLYKHSIPVPVPPNVMDQLEQVKKDMKLPQDVGKRISAFTNLGFDPRSIGCAKYKTGALIGIPANIAYQTANDLDKKNIVVGFKTVHWTSPDGLALESSLLLSDAAKKFALAREISAVNSHHLTMLCTLNWSTIFLYYYLAHSFNRKGNLFARPLKLRVTLYTLLGSFMFVTWLLVRDVLTVRRDVLADDEAASISEEYAQGALEFYDKTLKRNIALRSLLGEEGPNHFTALGNIRETVRTKHLPFVIRREAAATRCQKLAEAKKNSAEEKQKQASSTGQKA